MSSIAAPHNTRILVHGATGRMGTALLRLQSGQAQTTLAAAIARRGSSGPADMPITPAAQIACVPAYDVAIDFSLPDAFDAILDLSLARGAAFVSGTTGLDAAQHARLDIAARTIPVLWSANFSVGVAVLADLVRRAAAALPGWDCDIVESHHVHKKDAPSGTALRLGEAASAGGATPRVASIRAGDIVGEHLVQFTGQGERIELLHRATDRDVFARGALQAALWLAGRPAGRYAMHDMLGLAGG